MAASTVEQIIRRMYAAERARQFQPANGNGADSVAEAEEESALGELVGADNCSLADLELKLHALARMDLDDYAMGTLRPSWSVALMLSVLTDVRRLVVAQNEEAGQ